MFDNLLWFAPVLCLALAQPANEDKAKKDLDKMQGTWIMQSLEINGKDVPLKQLFNPEHPRYAEGGEFRELFSSDPEVEEVVTTAQGIEGLKRQWGVHACGVIMGSVPLTDVIPVMKREQDGAIITQFDYPSAESLGLVKMDFLGLRNLTVIDDALHNIKRNKGDEIAINDIALDDPATFDLCDGRHVARLATTKVPLVQSDQDCHDRQERKVPPGAVVEQPDQQTGAKHPH